MFWLALSMAASGVAANSAGAKQSSLMREQGILAQRDAERQAVIALDEGYRRRQKQTMEYIGAGVEVQGTPLLMLAETAKMAEHQAAEIRRTGKSARDLYYRNARAARSEGRASLVSSLLGAVGEITENDK